MSKESGKESCKESIYISVENHNKLTSSLKYYVEKCNDLIDQLKDENKLVEELKDKLYELENLDNKKDIKLLKKEYKSIIEKNKDKIQQLERDLLLKDGTIQRLEECKKDLKEMYTDLKDELKEYRMLRKI